MLSSSRETNRRILAVRLDNIGDVIMLGPALRALRQAFPEAQITLLASPAGSQIAPLLPWIDRVLVWQAIWQDVGGGLPFDPEREQRLVEILRAGRFDAAWVFTSFSQSPYPPAYACYLAGIPVRLGLSKEFGGGVLSHWGKSPADAGHQVDRNLALVASAGFPIAGRHLELRLAGDIQSEADWLLRESGVDPAQPFIVLAPGASCAARRYDPERFARVAGLLASQAGLPLVIVGSERESEILAPVLAVANGKASQSHNRIISLVGMTTVPQLAAIIRRASLLIANNSASLHLADAFRVPMVILYSGTEYESQWMPRNAPARLLRRYMSCSPCYNFRCPYGMECLDIQPQEVVDAALEIMNTVTSSPLETASDLSRVKE
jgi:lipopolysaccharide heptosyltransferase II